MSRFRGRKRGATTLSSSLSSSLGAFRESGRISNSKTGSQKTGVYPFSRRRHARSSVGSCPMTATNPKNGRTRPRNETNAPCRPPRCRLSFVVRVASPSRSHNETTKICPPTAYGQIRVQFPGGAARPRDRPNERSNKRTNERTNRAFPPRARPTASASASATPTRRACCVLPS